MGFLSPEKKYADGGIIGQENTFQARMPGQQRARLTLDSPEAYGMPGMGTNEKQGVLDQMNKRIDEENAANPGVTQTNFAPQIAAAQAANPSNVERLTTQPVNQSGQQALAQQLLAQARGQGPNPALLAMQQATNRNIQQGAGMIASQKGINPALQDRMIAQNAANVGQQAAGQGALMQAQQQLGAQNQLQGLYGQMGQQGLAQRQQDIAQNVQYNELMNQQRGMQNQYIGSLLGAQQGQNALNLQGSLGVQQINAGIAQQNQATNNKLLGAGLGAVGAIGGAMLGGPAGAVAGSQLGSLTADATNTYAGEPMQMGTASNPQYVGSKGGHVPGKAKVPGDDEDNDTVHALLSPGEIVVPRSKASDPDKAKEFIDALLSKKGKEVGNYSKVLEAKRKLKKKTIKD